MDHRFTTPPHGWLAGGWWNGDEPFCKWEYDTTHRLLFVDWADEFCIESLSDDATETLEEELPKMALTYAKQLADGSRRKVKAPREPLQTRDDKGVATTVRERLGLKARLDMATVATFRELSLYSRLSRPGA